MHCLQESEPTTAWDLLELLLRPEQLLVLLPLIDEAVCSGASCPPEHGWCGHPPTRAALASAFRPQPT
jgi:hypothetical protein